MSEGKLYVKVLELELVVVAQTAGGAALAALRIAALRMMTKSLSDGGFEQIWRSGELAAPRLTEESAEIQQALEAAFVAGFEESAGPAAYEVTALAWATLTPATPGNPASWGSFFSAPRCERVERLIRKADAVQDKGCSLWEGAQLEALAIENALGSSPKAARRSGL